MLCVISPAKTLDFDPLQVARPLTQPEFGADAARLARSAARLSRARLKALMELSDDLARLNYDRFKSYSPDPEPQAVKQAGFSFAGDTYAGLDFASLSPAAQDYAQRHLRILSGLYGLLRPFDAIQPYRLEMGRRLKTGRAESLYDYWGDRLAAALDDAAAKAGARAVVNLASTEYFRAAREHRMQTPVITPVFLDERNGTPKVISFFAKRARGAMARYVIENHLTDPQDLHGFAWEGYTHDPDASGLVFMRSESRRAA